MMRRLLVVALLLALISGCRGRGTLDTATADRLTADLEAALQTFDVPGAAFALVWPGGEHVAGVGIADIETQQRVTPDSRFAVASAIKPVAAAWIADWIRTGQVEWETTLGALWPELELGDAAALTVANAVYQQSGYLRDDWLWLGRNVSFTALADQLRTARRGPDSIPSSEEKFTYNNVVFVLALRGVERRVGEIFPFNTPDVTGYDRALDNRHIALPASARQPGTMSVVLDAGLSASDAVPLLRAMLTDPDLTRPPLANADMASCCPQGVVVRYGRGIFREDYWGVRVWLHDGYGLGYSAVLMVDLEAQIGVFIAANESRSPAFIHAMRYKVLERVYGLSADGEAAMYGFWGSSDRYLGEVMAQITDPLALDPAFLGDYGDEVQVIAVPGGGMALRRGVYEWPLLSLEAGRAMFASGPLIGAPLDVVCIEGVRRLVSAASVLAEGGTCSR